MSDSFEAEMLDFCVRFLTKRGDQLSAEQLSTLSVLFPRLALNPFDPTSSTFQWTLTVDSPFSEYVEPVELAYSSIQEAPATTIVETPAPPPPSAKRRSPYGYNGRWASPMPVLVAKEVIKRQYRVTLKDIVEKYAKHGEKRLTHEMAINFLADRKQLTPEEFLKTVDIPPRGTKNYWGVWTNRGNFCLTDW